VQHRLEKKADVLLVLDDENRFRPIEGGIGMDRNRVFLARLGHGKIKGNRGSLADLGLDVDVAAMGLHQAVNHRQAEAGAASAFLRRVEGLEDMLPRGGVDALAGVGDGQANIILAGKLRDEIG
jgi:hypothetical protein